MLQTYKLRLGDGTVLGVDHEGLSTWLVDRRAMVQAAGSRQWQPLREFLAHERAAAKRASKYALRKSTPRQELPLVYPKPRTGPEPAPPSPLAPPPSIPVEPASVEEPPAVRVMAAVPVLEAAPFLEAAPVLAAVPVLAGEPSVVIAEPVPLPAIPEEDDPLMPFEPSAEAGPGQFPATVWIDAEEPLTLGGPSEVQVAEVEPLLPPEPLDAVEAPAPFDASWDEELEPPPIAAIMETEIPAEQPLDPPQSLSPPQLVPDDDVPIIPFEALDPVEPEPSVVSPWRDPVERPLRAAVAPPLPQRPSLQVLADDPVARPKGPTRQAPIADDGMAIIPLKPLEEEEKPQSQAKDLGASDEEEDAVPTGPPWRVRLEEIVRALISAAYPVVSDWSHRLAARDWTWLRRRPRLPDIKQQLVAWVAGLTRWGAAFTRQDSAPPKAPASEAAASQVVDLDSSPPLEPPLPILELPVLQFAYAPEPEETGDVYEGESLLPTVWLWAKRIMVTSGLVAVGLVAALSWQRWTPTATQFGLRVVSEIDRRVESRGQVERQQEALQEATVQLPYLLPDSIRLILSTGPEGVLDPPEVFSVACDAADRGLSALTPAEANELKVLRVQLLNTLRPSERERIREYGRVRTRRIPFAFENRDVLDLYATGARVLPSQSRERLQELWGKAIAAGLGPKTEVVPPTGEQ